MHTIELTERFAIKRIACLGKRMSTVGVRTQVVCSITQNSTLCHVLVAEQRSSLSSYLHKIGTVFQAMQ